MASTKTTGDLGEDIATEYLQNQGFTIVERNYRYKRAEIDIIARKSNLLVFFEVKARKGNAYGYPEEAVDEKKSEMVLLAANNYIYETGWIEEIRFDIISISMQEEQEITHFEDAFY